MAVLTVSRPSEGFRDSLVRYRLDVDGRKVAKLARGAYFSMPLTPGPHIVQAKSAWLSSRKLELDVAGDESISLSCEPGGSAFLALVDQLLRPRSYIRLEIISRVRKEPPQ